MIGTPYASNAGVFLVQAIFGFYILVVMLRFLLQWARANFYNPLVQFLVKLTNPPLLPMRRYIPGLMGLDMSAVVLMVVLQIVEWLLVLAIVNQPFGLAGVLVLSVASLLGLLIRVFFWAILIQAILSWVNPDPRHPAVSLLWQLTEPVLRPARGLIPPISGLDLSPLVMLIGLQLLIMLLVHPLQDVGYSLLQS